MVPEELFGKLLKYHLLDQKQEEDDIKKGLEKKLDTMINRELYSKYKTAATEEEREKVPAGISGKKGNTGKLSMVKLLVDYSITGACHAPVNIRQGKGL